MCLYVYALKINQLLCIEGWSPGKEKKSVENFQLNKKSSDDEKLYCMPQLFKRNLVGLLEFSQYNFSAHKHTAY